MWLFEPETLRFLAMNDTAVAQYGYSRAEFLQMTLNDIRPRGDAAAGFLPAREFGPGTAAHGLYKHTKKDGSDIDVELTLQKFVFDGSAIGVGEAELGLSLRQYSGREKP